MAHRSSHIPHAASHTPHLRTPLPDGFDAVLFTQARPLRVPSLILLPGNPMPAASTPALRTAFDHFERDDDGPATRATGCVSSPKWKCGVTVCWVRCTARYPANTSAGAAPPLRANASGSTSVIATASMNPAPKATKCSITLRPRAARWITAAAPSRLPPAAISPYHRALDRVRPG